MIYRLILLKAAAVNAPILNYKKCPIKPLLMTESDSNHYDKLKKQFSLPFSKITIATSSEEVNRILTTQNIGFIIVYPETLDGRPLRSSKQQEKFERILAAALQGAVNAVVVFVFEGKIPEEYRKRLTHIRLEVDKKAHGVINGYPVPNPDQIELAMDQCRQIKDKVEGYEWVYMSAAFLYPVLLNTKQEDLYSKIVQEAKAWVQEMQQFKDEENLVELFCECIEDFVENSVDLYMLSGRVDLPEAELDKKVCVRQKYLYLTEKHFEEALREYHEEFTLDFAKELLRDAEIICPDSGKGYLSQMRYYDSAGHSKRPYRLRFNIGILFKNGIPESLSDTFPSLMGGDAYGNYVR